MALFDLELRPQDHQLKSFGLFWLPGFCLLAALLGWLRFDQQLLAQVLTVIAVVSVCASLIQPRILQPLFVILMIVTFPIGVVVSHLLIAVVYYLCITPIGLALRLFGRDAMKRRFPAGEESYWIERHEVEDHRRYFRQF
jgi:hypothetical protein